MDAIISIIATNLRKLLPANYYDCMIVFLLTIAAALGALAGGVVALRSRDRLHTALAVTSGLVLGLVAFDLLPEIFEAVDRQKLDPAWPMIAFVVGFLFFHALEKFILLHQGEESEYGPHEHPKLGVARAAALAGHSFLDGLSIGVGFQVSTSVGYAVALAVVGHRFADGFDTTSFMLFHRNKLEQIKKILAIVVVMPILGGLASLVISFSESALAVYLGFFAGLLMYVASGNILPQAHTKSASYFTLALTLIGAVFMFIVTRFV
jgi:ZIP family zinc transporter